MNMLAGWFAHGWRALCACLIVAALSGCASQQSYVVLIPSPDGSVGKVYVTGKDGHQVLDRAGQAATTDGKALGEAVDAARLDKDFAAAIAARPPLPEHFLIYFKSGVELTRESEALIPKILQSAMARPVVDVSVIGNTDTLHTDEFNEKLALRRARRVAKLLEDAGLSVNSMVIESHGKRNLLVPTPDNTYEPKNRRVEVTIR